MVRKDTGRHPWVFTEARKKSLRKARQEHERLVALGKRISKRRSDRDD